MKVTLIARTVIMDASVREVVPAWEPEDDDFHSASLLSEFAGRACYESWAKPNPATATNQGYIENILKQEHYSVLEHGSVSFYIEGVSRSLTHELVRHRHLSPSQLSQRFVDMSKPGFNYVTPPLYREATGFGADEVQRILEDTWDQAMRSYERLVEITIPGVLASVGGNVHRARKVAREAARCVLPNMTPTAMVLTGNHRAWRDLIEKRATLHADAEINELAIELLRQLSELEPAIYQDFDILEGERR